MKKRFVVMLICATLLLAGEGVTIAYETAKSNKDEINVDVDNGQVSERVISVTDLNLYPGGEKAYTVKFASKSADNIAVTLEFEETEAGELKNYVTVTVSSGEKTESAGLKELLEGKRFVFTGKIEKLTLTYKMDESAGNDVQGAGIKFDVRIKASAN